MFDFEYPLNLAGCDTSLIDPTVSDIIEEHIIMEGCDNGNGTL